MLLSKDAIRQILGIKEDVCLGPKNMARQLNVTFFPRYNRSSVSKRVEIFVDKLRDVFFELGVNVIPYQQALVRVPLKKLIKRKVIFFVKNLKILYKKLFILFNKKDIGAKDKETFLKVKGGKKVRAGIAIIIVGEGVTGDLPVDNKMSFKDNPVITIIDTPSNITAKSSYKEHMETALRLFTWNMANIVITVGVNSWRVYSHNGSYFTYSLRRDFKYNVLWGLISKIAAPVKPPDLKEFIINTEAFDPKDKYHYPHISDLVEGALLFDKTGLYPERKRVDDLPFRNNFYRWVGSIHLDERKGMSYGFIARQLPVKLTIPLLFEDAVEQYGLEIEDDRKDWFVIDNEIYIVARVEDIKLFIQVPEVWVLTSKSGADKTHLDASKDIVKIGMVSGQMVIETPKGITSLSNFRPSFDTKVILAHAIGNAIFAIISAYFQKNMEFVRILQRQGIALAHWHGYISPEFIPRGWYYHGHDNPPVSCSSPQSAFYAFRGKEQVLIKSLNNDQDFRGDIHIEPDHGTNMHFNTLKGLAKFLLDNPQACKLGNEYFLLY